MILPPLKRTNLIDWAMKLKVVIGFNFIPTPVFLYGNYNILSWKIWILSSWNSWEMRSEIVTP
jgi:hypothetical protein